MITCEPDVKQYKLDSKMDFIILGCDGIFERASDKDVVKLAWEQIKKLSKQNIKSSHEISGEVAHSIVKESMIRKSSDNVTVLIISFKKWTQNKLSL